MELYWTHGNSTEAAASKKMEMVMEMAMEMAMLLAMEMVMGLAMVLILANLSRAQTNNIKRHLNFD